MAAKKVDWSILRGTVIVFTVCVLVSIGMLAASFYFKQNMQREYQSNHMLFRNASQQYLAVDEEERIIEEFYPEFVRLFRAGLLGQERRLSWLETLRRAGDAIKIPDLNYKLEAQRETTLEYELDIGGYIVRASAMDLHLGLIHEGDILRLLDVLDRDALGQYTVRECNFSIVDKEFDLDATRPNVQVDCKLDWLTLDLSGTAELSL